MIQEEDEINLTRSHNESPFKTKPYGGQDESGEISVSQSTKKLINGNTDLMNIVKLSIFERDKI